MERVLSKHNNFRDRRHFHSGDIAPRSVAPAQGFTIASLAFFLLIHVPLMLLPFSASLVLCVTPFFRLPIETGSSSRRPDPSTLAAC